MSLQSIETSTFILQVTKKYVYAAGKNIKYKFICSDCRKAFLQFLKFFFCLTNFFFHIQGDFYIIHAHIIVFTFSSSQRFYLSCPISLKS